MVDYSVLVDLIALFSMLNITKRCFSPFSSIYAFQIQGRGWKKSAQNVISSFLPSVKDDCLDVFKSGAFIVNNYYDH